MGVLAHDWNGWLEETCTQWLMLDIKDMLCDNDVLTDGGAKCRSKERMLGLG
jgi:hypothetical protein